MWFVQRKTRPVLLVGEGDVVVFRAAVEPRVWLDSQRSVAAVVPRPSAIPGAGKGLSSFFDWKDILVHLAKRCE